MSKYRIAAPHSGGHEYTADTLPELNEAYRSWMQYSMIQLRQLNEERARIEQATLEFQRILAPYWDQQQTTEDAS